MNDADEEMKQAAREAARELEAGSQTTAPYPSGTHISRPNRPSRMCNLRYSSNYQ